MILRAAPGQPGFLREMFGIQAEHRPASACSAACAPARDPAHRAQINLKLAGTLPLAEAVRLLALRARDRRDRHACADRGAAARAGG